jgi:gamma-carbonic anhydrase
MRLFVEFPDGSYRAHNAVVVGDVQIGPQSSIWFGAVIRGDVAPISLGRRVNVQDNAVIHADTGYTNTIEDDVLIGHSAVIHGLRVGRGSFIGMNATLLARSVIGEQCLVAAGAVVPPDMLVPPRHLIAGVPAKVLRPLKDEDLKYMEWASQHYVNLANRYLRGEFEPKG